MVVNSRSLSKTGLDLFYVKSLSCRMKFLYKTEEKYIPHCFVHSEYLVVTNIHPR